MKKRNSIEVVISPNELLKMMNFDVRKYKIDQVWVSSEQGIEVMVIEKKKWNIE